MAEQIDLIDIGRYATYLLSKKLTVAFGCNKTMEDLNYDDHLYIVVNDDPYKNIAKAMDSLAYRINYRNRFSPRIHIPKKKLMVVFCKIGVPAGCDHITGIVVASGIPMRVMREYNTRDGLCYNFDVLCKFKEI